jgi:hypothetical protein
MNHDSFIVYVRDGTLRADIDDTGLEEGAMRAADWAMVVHEKHFNRYEYMIWDIFETTRPYRVLAAEGVPLVTLYKRGYR